MEEIEFQVGVGGVLANNSDLWDDIILSCGFISVNPKMGWVEGDSFQLGFMGDDFFGWKSYPMNSLEMI